MSKKRLVIKLALIAIIAAVTITALFGGTGSHTTVSKPPTDSRSVGITTAVHTAPPNDGGSPASQSNAAPVHQSVATIAKAPQGPTISLSIQGLYTKKPVAITSGETMLALLQAQNAADPAMQLTSKSYAGLGTLVTGMGGFTNGTDKNYWQYTVNGIMPQIGASGYQLQNGDRVEWFFGPSQN